MIKKLLFLVVLTISIQGYSQATANIVSNLVQCDYEVFDLTVQDSSVLGIQDPTLHSVKYYLTNMDALTDNNEIADPTAFVGGMNNTIYIRVTNLNDNSSAITSFLASWNFTPQVAPIADVSVCDSYTLPSLPPDHQYFYSPGGNGQIYSAGTIITFSQTLYVWAENGQCGNGTSFSITIVPTPVTPQVSNVTACDLYTLPPLPQFQNYYTVSGGEGTTWAAGDVITSTMMIFVFAQIGSCTSEASFMVTINSTPNSENYPDVTSCGSYILPPLPPEGSYSFNGVPLFGTEPFVIDQSGVVTMTLANFCSVEFLVEITDMTPINLAPFVVCDENGNGTAAFDLTTVAAGINFNGQGSSISFYETQTDAEMGFVNNSLSSPYTPFFNNQTIYVRISDGTGPAGCYVISTLLLVAGDCTNNIISGTVTLDFDNNGCTASNATMENVPLSRTNAGATTYAYTNAEGYYEFTNVPAGSNVISVGLASGYTAMPGSALVEVAGTGQSGTANFCVVPPPAINDVSVFLIPAEQPRPGFPANYYLIITNEGTTSLSGSATFTFDSVALDFVSSTPAQVSQTTNSITFDFESLAPSENLYYYISFIVMIPPTVDAGYILDSAVTVLTEQADVDLLNNTYELSQVVVNSYDPNDITCHEGAYISEQQAADYLHYTIRFQNTGTADAVNVRLENALDSLLDWSTFQPIASSHTYLAERNDGELVFRYTNIMLPGSQEDEPGSHGFITYRIKPLPGFEIGELISSTADIFFDFNAAITTNTATTQIQQLSVSENNLATFKVYPNPAEGIVTIHFEDAANVFVSVVDLQGKRIFSEERTLINNETALDVSAIQSGMYLLKISSGNRNEVTKLIIR